MEVLILDSELESARQKREIIKNLGYKAKIISYLFNFNLAKKGDLLLIDGRLVNKIDIDVIADEAGKQGISVIILTKNFINNENNLKKILDHKSC